MIMKIIRVDRTTENVRLEKCQSAITISKSCRAFLKDVYELEIGQIAHVLLRVALAPFAEEEKSIYPRTKAGDAQIKTDLADSLLTE